MYKQSFKYYNNKLNLFFKKFMNRLRKHDIQVFASIILLSNSYKQGHSTKWFEYSCIFQFDLRNMK